MPEELRQLLLAKGHRRIDIGNIAMDMATGTITRTIALDGVDVAKAQFEGAEIDWGVVSEAIQ